MLLIINVIVNGFVTSGTGQAAVVMPVLVPVADIAGNLASSICTAAIRQYPATP